MMDRSLYARITKIISQTIRFLDRRDRLSPDDLDEIKNQTLLKLTPQLKKILDFEPLHLQNFIRKTTRSVFWDYLKDMSLDLSQFRLKKRIKSILASMEDAKSQFKRPDNDSPWFKDEQDLLNGITPQEKQRQLELLLEKWQNDSPPGEKSSLPDERLSELVGLVIHQAGFGVSVNEIYSLLAGTVNIEDLTQTSLDSSAVDRDGETTLPLLDLIRGEDVPTVESRMDEELVWFENYAEEFLNKRVSPEQTRVYYLRFTANLGYKEIEQTYGINIKTAESRLSLKPDKKGFLWRLVQYIRQLELTLDECRTFFFILDRKIGERYSNTR